MTVKHKESCYATHLSDVRSRMVGHREGYCNYVSEYVTPEQLLTPISVLGGFDHNNNAEGRTSSSSITLKLMGREE